MSEEVQAAGGVVVRDGRVAVVHRPKYEDWTLPKGKLDPSEGFEEAALREVLEETGLRCTLGPELVSSNYVDGRGRPKVVRYWAMTVAEAFERQPDDEVDAMAWLPIDTAERRLTYGRDVEVLDAFARWAGERAGH